MYGLIYRSRYKHKDTAEAMGVGLSSIQRWVSQFKKEQKGTTPKATVLTPEQLRIQQLEKQVKQLESDNALLKKSVSLLRNGNEQRQQVAVKLKKAGHPVQQICRCLKLASSSFYYRLKPKLIDAEKVRLEAAMKHIHNDMDATQDVI